MIDEWTIVNRREIGNCTDDAFVLHHRSCTDWLSGPASSMPHLKFYTPAADRQRPYVFQINDFFFVGGGDQFRRLIKATFPNVVIDGRAALFSKDDLAIIKLASSRLHRRTKSR